MISSLLRTASGRILKNLPLHTPWLTKIARDTFWKINERLNKLNNNANYYHRNNIIGGTLSAIGKPEECWQKTKIGATIKIISREDRNKATVITIGIRRVDQIRDTILFIARGWLKKVRRSVSLPDPCQCAARVLGPWKGSRRCISFIASQGTRNLKRRNIESSKAPIRISPASPSLSRTSSKFRPFAAPRNRRQYRSDTLIVHT